LSAKACFLDRRSKGGYLIVGSVCLPLTSSKQIANMASAVEAAGSLISVDA
jgi:hypothetical protein